MRLKKGLAVFATALILAAGCKKDGRSPDGPDNKSAPDNFQYGTSKSLDVDIKLLSNSNEPLKGIPLELLTADSSSVFIMLSNENGEVKGNVTVPAYVDTLYAKPRFTGLISGKIFVKDNKIEAVLGGSQGYSGNFIDASVLRQKEADSETAHILAYADGIDFNYPSPYTSTFTAVTNTSEYPISLGRPKYLDPEPYNISPLLLSYINASLPEGSPVADHHPAYLDNNAVSVINVIENSDIYVSFISEGASYTNTLGYYTYPTSNPPKNPNKIDDATIIFPNASAKGSGGGLISGDKVNIGRFSAGTTIAFVLIQDAWSSFIFPSVNVSNQKFFSEPDFNPESTASLKKHSVTLYDNIHKLFVMGFEDCNRQSASQNPSRISSDHDFNDLIVSVSSAALNAISASGVQPIDKADDADGDGVTDDLDEFPNDNSKAYTSYFPAKEKAATLAFEDNWPKTGDYDMNDLLVNYQYAFTRNAKNEIVDMTGSFTVTAAGASFYNGFGVEFPFSPSLVSQVTGQKHIGSYIQLSANGLEAGQRKAVIIPFDNHEALIKNNGGAFFINTEKEKPKVSGETAAVFIKFVSPVSETILGEAPFNPFLISNQRRGYEIHLPGYTPTDKADTKLFGTDADNSSAAASRYYLTKDNNPWAISFTEEFAYPYERAKISEAYLHFSEWAASGGAKFADWYKNTASGYRDSQYIYSK